MLILVKFDKIDIGNKNVSKKQLHDRREEHS